MVEKNLIINGKTLQYKGIFQEDKLFSVINNFLDKNGYTKFEKKSEELVVQKGRETLIELRPYKVLATYMTFQLRIKIVIQIDSEVREEVDGIPQHFQNGTVSMIFDSWLISDYVFRWQMKPIVYFLKGIINKFIFTFPLEAGFPDQLTDDTAKLYGKVKKHLNSYTKPTGKKVPEEDVKKAVKLELHGPPKEDLEFNLGN